MSPQRVTVPQSVKEQFYKHQLRVWIWLPYYLLLTDWLRPASVNRITIGPDNAITPGNQMNQLWLNISRSFGNRLLWNLMMILYLSLPDRYDAITGAGLLLDSNVREDCFLELIRVVKPGIQKYRDPAMTWKSFIHWLTFVCMCLGRWTPLTSEIPSERAIYVELWLFLCC